MRRAPKLRHALLAATLLAGCGQDEPPANPVTNRDVPSQGKPWNLATEGDGATLSAAGPSGEAAIRLFCPAGLRTLVVNVTAFQPVGSEERMTFGQSGTVETLVADPSGDAVRGGVTAEGPVPTNLVELLSGPVAANYGSQNSGPHPTPPAALVNAFARSCGGNVSGGSNDGGASQASSDALQPTGQAAEGRSACLTGRDGRALPPNRIRGVGTEPFWAVSVEGRCVTYSHPEDQSGTRVWTEFSGTAESGTWSGFLNDRPFVMKTRPQQGCSDGMSDRRYPIAVNLTVNGEQRQGCAAPR